MKGRRTLHPVLRAVLCGVLGLLLTFLMSLVTAKLISVGYLPIRFGNIAAYVMIGVSVLVCCTLSAKQSNSLRLLFTAATAAVYFLVLLIANGILQKGAFERLLPTAGIVVGAMLCGVLLGLKRKKGEYRVR